MSNEPDFASWRLKAREGVLADHYERFGLPDDDEIWEIEEFIEDEHGDGQWVTVDRPLRLTVHREGSWE